MRRVLWIAFLGAGLAFAQEGPRPVEAKRAIVEAFQKHPVVAIGELHWMREAGDFYADLIRMPGFADTVDDIVVEFSTPRYQSTIDRYTNGESVSAAELREVWRNTTKVFAWESPIYPRLLATVREVNSNRPKTKRLHVLGGDAPIDWTTVKTNEQWADFQPNDRAFAKTIEEQVLARHRKALVILGSNHLTLGGDRDRGPDTTTRVEERYPGSIYVVLIAAPNYGEDRALMAEWRAPAMAPIGAWAAGKPFGKRHLDDSGHALLYLGRLTKAQPEWEKLDEGYLRELDRRSRIEWGCGFDLSRWKAGQRPCP